MNEDQSVKDTLKAVNQGRGKKIAYLVLAAVAVALLIGAFLSKTRGTDVEESSAAMVESTHEGQEAAASSPDAMPQASP